MSSSLINKQILRNALLLGAGCVLCLAIVARAQYNTFDSDSNADSDGNPILTQAELGKLVRNSGRLNSAQAQRHHQQHAAATRNLYNRQQPLQYAPSHNNKRNNYASSDSLSGYAPMGAASNGRGNQNSDADDEDSNFGPNFGSNFDSGNNNNDDGEGSSNSNDGQPMNLNQAASGYPAQGDYSGNDAATVGFGFGGASGYGPSSSNDGSDFGPSSDGFVGEGRRAKSASSPRGFGLEEDSGAPQYGPNSAVNGDSGDDEGRAGYSPENQNDNDNDDE